MKFLEMDEQPVNIEFNFVQRQRSVQKQMNSVVRTTPKCVGCKEKVYFAEQIMSLGKPWHKRCLKCTRCTKVLSPGQHAEHEDKPYCTIPCYSYLFGPKGFGRGGTESHQY